MGSGHACLRGQRQTSVSKGTGPKSIEVGIYEQEAGMPISRYLECNVYFPEVIPSSRTCVLCGAHLWLLDLEVICHYSSEEKRRILALPGCISPMPFYTGQWSLCSSIEN